MRAARPDELEQWLSPSVLAHLRGLKGVFVSLSGGVDSSAVLALLAGILPKERIVAVNFNSWLHPPREGERARKLCKTLGVEFRRLPGPEMSDRGVLCNAPDRCRRCKSLRLASVEAMVIQTGYTVVDGTNADDIRDPTRLGNQVLEACSYVYSPFARSGLDKGAVRRIAALLGIEWAYERATACMATRFPRGVQLTEEGCRRAAAAEEALEAFGVGVRLRIFGDTVCLEFPRPVDLASCPCGTALKVLKGLGYQRVMVDLEGYQTGREWLSALSEVCDDV